MVFLDVFLVLKYDFFWTVSKAEYIGYFFSGIETFFCVELTWQFLRETILCHHFYHKFMNQLQNLRKFMPKFKIIYFLLEKYGLMIMAICVILIH
jgi:hypothetical protein